MKSSWLAWICTTEPETSLASLDSALPCSQLRRATLLAGMVGPLCSTQTRVSLPHCLLASEKPVGRASPFTHHTARRTQLVDIYKETGLSPSPQLHNSEAALSSQPQALLSSPAAQEGLTVSPKGQDSQDMSTPSRKRKN